MTDKPPPLYPLRFEPLCQYRLWGGRCLAHLLSAPIPGDGPYHWRGEERAVHKVYIRREDVAQVQRQRQSYLAPSSKLRAAIARGRAESGDKLALALLHRPTAAAVGHRQPPWV